MGYEEVRELVGKKRTLEILELLESEMVLNYSEIESRISTSSDVVSKRLRFLAEYGLIDREERSAKDVRYSITERGTVVLEYVRELESLLEK